MSARRASDVRSLTLPGPLQYMPDGNVKWGRLEVDTRDPAKPRVDFEVRLGARLQMRLAG